MIRRIVACAVVVTSLAGAADTAPIRVGFENGKLSVSAHDAPAADVFSAIAEKTGVRFVIGEGIQPGPITIALEAMPLEQAIRNLVAAVPQVAGNGIAGNGIAGNSIAGNSIAGNSIAGNSIAGNGIAGNRIAGSSMKYARDEHGEPKLVEVAFFGPGKASAASTAQDSATSDAPTVRPAPALDERKTKMIEDGAPPATAERVIELEREVEELKAPAAAGTSYAAEDLSAFYQEYVPLLVERGIPTERAVRLLLLQERRQELAKERRAVPGSNPLGAAGAR